MKEQNMTNNYILEDLKERAKELNCLYQVDEILANQRLSLAEIFQELIKVIPLGWQHPKFCRVRIIYDNRSYEGKDFISTDISQSSSISADGKTVGRIEVFYINGVPKGSQGYFLEKEDKLLKTIADRISQMILNRHMEEVIREWHTSKQNQSAQKDIQKEWMVIVKLLQRTDSTMLLHLSRKMLSYLYSRDVKEIEEVLWDLDTETKSFFDYGEVNYPTEKYPLSDINKISQQTFDIASHYLSDKEIASRLKKWIQEEKASALIKTIDGIDNSLREIVDAITKYRNIVGENTSLYSPSEHWLLVALIRIFLSHNLQYISKIRSHLEVKDFYHIVKRLIFPKGSQGKIGGKGAGLFVAKNILKKESTKYPELKTIKVPKTWYITSDELKEFLHYNNLEELNIQKYKELFEIRADYPNIIQIMKNGQFPEDIIKSLAMALDDFGDSPLIVRSSSILEDQMGSAFSGKYKSLFLANQGDKKQRLEALMDAIIEVYASMYSPDSIQYREKRGLLDYPEEMGIMIQEVVGTRVGEYFLPLYSGVAFSRNEFRWSSRLKREDGLIRMVMGLGTRAVDRVGDDFPVLISPGQPGLDVNTVPEEIKKYSPKKIDLINLDKQSFETVDLRSFLQEYGSSIPNIHQLISRYKDDYVEKLLAFNIDFAKDDLLVNFAGLYQDTNFINKVELILNTLEKKLDYPVDIEFASDGQDIYLLQCRPQSFSPEIAPAPIPKDLKEKDIIFSAKRYISNGIIENISHIVYIDPDRYSNLEVLEDYLAVGKAVGLLNSLLPKQRFILIGPGRWGSRGNVKMGVQVSYADINNTAALIEIAKKKSNYIPDLSFGTHFFLDLVEANIRYLPLYPDDKEIIFNERFLKRQDNILSRVLPDFRQVEDVVRVIDIPKLNAGKVLTISMNGDLEEALAYLTDPAEGSLLETKIDQKEDAVQETKVTLDEKYWRWRYYMAERIAKSLDFSSYGLQGIYLFGSTNNRTAGLGSDIDLLIHFIGEQKQKERLLQVLEGWSTCLAEINYMKTGYRSEGLLDVHIVTDEDIKNNNVFAAKINAVTDPAYPLKVME